MVVGVVEGYAAGVAVALGGVDDVITSEAIPGFRLRGTDADEAG